MRAGARRFVYVSFSHHIEVDCPLTTAKRTVERHLTQSGLDYTILAPSFYMEVWLGPALGFDMKSGKAQIFGSGKNAISWISLGDVARFAAVAIEHPKAKNATIELGGPEALAPLDVVRTCEELCGRSFEVQHVPEAALRDQRAAATDSYQQTFTALMLAYAAGDPIDMRSTLETFPVPLTSVRDYAQQVLRG